MENSYFKNEKPDKSIVFIISLLGILLFAIMGVGIDLDQYLQFREQNVEIPDWYFYIIFPVDFFVLASIVLIYFYKKIGVYLYPLAMCAHFIFHLYYLGTFLYSDITGIFLFIGIGLFAIIPKWQFFK